MNLKFFTRSLPFVSRILPGAKRGMRDRADSPVLMTFAAKGNKGQQGARHAAYTVRVVHACEMHRTRSLLEMGNCSMHCTKSCMLADMQRDE